jgi:hypothetical protein
MFSGNVIPVGFIFIRIMLHILRYFYVRYLILSKIPRYRCVCITYAAIYNASSTLFSGKHTFYYSVI